MPSPIPASPITPHEAAMRDVLTCCTFVPGSSHKRFARDMAHATALTEAQRRQLIRLCWRYRRQMPSELVPSGDAVQAMDADWNLRQRAAAERKAADREATRRARQIAKDGGDGAQMEDVFGA